MGRQDREDTKGDEDLSGTVTNKWDANVIEDAEVDRRQQ